MLNEYFSVDIRQVRNGIKLALTALSLVHVDYLLVRACLTVSLCWVVQGHLHTLPLLLEKCLPHMRGLPTFLLRLATEVDWDSEKECFDGVARELAYDRAWCFGHLFTTFSFRDFYKHIQGSHGSSAADDTLSTAWIVRQHRELPAPSQTILL